MLQKAKENKKMNITNKFIWNLSSNLITETKGNLEPTEIAKWCISQHFNYEYRYIPLLAVALISLFAYEAILSFALKIPKIKIKNMVFLDEESLLKLLFSLSKFCIMLFLFLWL